MQIIFIFGANYFLMRKAFRGLSDKDKERLEKKISLSAAKITWWAVGIYKDKFLREVLEREMTESELWESIIYEHYKRKNT